MSKTKPEDNTKTEDGVELTSWYLSPIKIPVELKDEIVGVAKEHDMSLAEFVLVATVRLAGFDDETALAARRLCYPKGKRDEPAANTVKATEPDEEK